MAYCGFLFFSGTDYACDVHVISVDSCSPAERAGVKAGDVIVEVSICSLHSSLELYFFSDCLTWENNCGQQAFSHKGVLWMPNPGRK